jgi:hypothetical protein
MKLRCIGKSNTNSLPAPTDLTKNPSGEKKLVFKDANQKSATMVPWEFAIELEPWRPIFENVLIFETKGGC